MKIFIDPGHSGPCEPGACAEGYTEADLNMRIARFTEQELELRGHEVQLSRDGPVEDAELEWRAENSNDWGADLFLSIHCNSFGRVEAEGTETHYFPGSEKGERLARCIQYRICDALLTEDRGVKASNFEVLRETVAVRDSTGGRYVSIKLNIKADTREEYEAAHQALRDHPEVKWTL